MHATLRHRILTMIAAAAILLAPPRLLATPPAIADFTVGDEATLRLAIGAAFDGDTITFINDITLTADLPAVQSNVTILGQNHVLSGGDEFRGFFIGKFSGTTQVAVTVTIQDLTIAQARAHGGDGGWGDQGMSGAGGAALGGAIFVADQAQLTISNVTLQNNTAQGGAGGVFSGEPGVPAGGGGLGGNGGHATALFAGAGGGGGGGLGRGAAGGKGNGGGAGSPGTAIGAASGGRGASGNAGGLYGGGGGSASGSDFGAAAGGGVGGGNGAGPGTGGNGGFGGGGGGGAGIGLGGDGGYGGGGGGNGGNGGFGGGGGAGSGLAGWAGGAGGAQTAGGGAALGGALFVQAGGTLVVEGHLTIDGNAVSGGEAVLDGVNGSAFGSGLFIAGGGTITFNPAAGETQTIANDIADQSGSGGSGPYAGMVALTKTGAGTLVLGGTNTYSDWTTVSAGTLIVNGVIGLSSQVLVEGGATLGGSGTIGLTAIEPGGWLAPDGVLHVSDLAAGDGGRLAIDLHGTAPGSYDQIAVAGLVSIADSLLSVAMDFSPMAGDIFTIIDTAVPSSLAGTFQSLPDNAVMTVNGRHLRINYGDDVTLTVLQETPPVSAAASAGVAFGGSIHDTATIAGGFSPTGTVTFRAYGPGDPSCSLAPVFTDTKPVLAGAAISSDFTPAAAGLYRWIATYSGDVNNAPSASACGNPSQAVTIAKADQTVTIDPVAPQTLGNAPFPVTATSTSLLPVTEFSSLTSSVCGVAGNLVTLIGVGTCTIGAGQGGNGNYNAAAQATRSFTVGPNCALVSTGPTQLPLGVVGLPYSQAFSLTGGPAPASFTIVGALPAGLTFGNGTISGTPTARGAFPIAITGTDAHACQATVSLSLAVSAERRLVVGAGAGGPATVRAFTVASPVLAADFTAFASPFTDGVSVAQGDVDGDGVAEVIAGTGPGGAPRVAVFDTTGGLRLSFLAFESTFRTGIEVAAGDVTGDGIPEILATGGCAGPFAVRAFNGVTGALMREYPITGPVWSCGLHLAAGDVNGDGIADLVLGSGGVSAPFVQVVNGASGTVLRDFYAYDLGFTAGVYVAAADITGDGLADIVTGAGPGGGPHVRVFDGVTGAAIAGPLASFMAYDPAFRGGVRVAAGDLNGDGRAEVITGPGPGGGPHVRAWDGASAIEIFGVFALDPAFTGGVFVAGPPATGRMTIDLATSTGGAMRIAGWALREGLGNTNGTDAVHVWAFPVGGGAPVFVGATMDRGARPDVAAALGGEFLRSGFDVTGTLTPGTYDLVVYVRNSRTLRFDQARLVRITVP